jgi:hypothetical protein
MRAFQYGAGAAAAGKIRPGDFAFHAARVKCFLKGFS